MENQDITIVKIPKLSEEMKQKFAAEAITNKKGEKVLELAVFNMDKVYIALKIVQRPDPVTHAFNEPELVQQASFDSQFVRLTTDASVLKDLGAFLGGYCKILEDAQVKNGKVKLDIDYAKEYVSAFKTD